MKFKQAILKSIKIIIEIIPLFIGMVLLISLIKVSIPNEFYENFFTNNIIVDSIMGSMLGSILAGNSITSYIFGKEFLDQGVSLVAVTAFLISWVTVGIIQIPAEIKYFGKKFTISRNIISFVFSIIIAILTVFIYERI